LPNHFQSISTERSNNEIKPNEQQRTIRPPCQRLTRATIRASASDANAAAVAVLTDDGISYLLPYAQFLYAERTANPALEKEPEASPEKMSIHFGCAEVIVLGSGLKRLERWLQGYELSFVMSADSRLAAVYDTLITAITITLTKENV
jgi:hypothetical protein